MPTSPGYINPNPNTVPTAAGDVSYWNTNFAQWGAPLIVWGTEGLYGYYIVLSASETQRIETIPITQGAGFTAILVQLMDGLDLNIEVVDDTSITPPVFGAPVTFVTPYGTVTMALTKNEANQAPKREGHRSFTFSSYTAIAGLH